MEIPIWLVLVILLCTPALVPLVWLAAAVVRLAQWVLKALGIALEGTKEQGDD